MPNELDWHAYLAKQESIKRERTRQEANIPQLRDVSYKAQQVVDHPGWQYFSDRLTTRIAAIEARRASTTHTMIYSDALGQKLELLKIELNVMDAELAGLKYALNLIPLTVAEGQRIAGEAEQPAAAASADNSKVE
mgnify:CR=1 FL=1